MSSDSKAVKVEIPEHDLGPQTRRRCSDKMVYDKSRAHEISLLFRRMKAREVFSPMSVDALLSQSSRMSVMLHSVTL